MDGGNVTINDDSGDYDFRVESNGSANMLFVDGGNEEVLIQRAASGGTATAGSVLIVEDDDNAEISLLGGSSSVLAINFGHSGDVDDGMIQYNTTSGSENMAFTVNAAARMTVGLGGDVDVETGDIFFSTAGKGICLGVTSNTDSNTLDDYEEGTWQPAFVSASGTITAHASASLGTYTKIGNLVHLQSHIQVSAISSPSGALTISGMPFTVNANTAGEDSGAATGTIEATGMASSLHILQISATGNGTSIRVTEFDGTNKVDDVANHWDTGSEIRIAMTYKV